MPSFSWNLRCLHCLLFPSRLSLTCTRYRSFGLKQNRRHDENDRSRCLIGLPGHPFCMVSAGQRQCDYLPESSHTECSRVCLIIDIYQHDADKVAVRRSHALITWRIRRYRDAVQGLALAGFHLCRGSGPPPTWYCSYSARHHSSFSTKVSAHQIHDRHLLILSPLSFAAAGVITSTISGTPTLSVQYPGSTVASFDLKSFWFGFAENGANAITDPPVQGTLTLTGYRKNMNTVGATYDVCAQTFKYDPTTMTGGQQQAYAEADSWYVQS